MNELDRSYSLTEEQVARFRSDGFVKLKEVLSADTLAAYGAEITRTVQELNTQHLPIHERSTYAKAFLQITNLWEHSAKVKEFVLAKRLGQIAAQLMGVDGVRLYHDQALFKEPGGGFTPWHADQYYWPMGSDHTVTAWIPLQAVTAEMGPLAFCVGSQQILANRDIAISDESEQKISRSLKDYPQVESPYALGEVSFHAGWTFHRAGPNETDQMRGVMTIIYMDAQMRVGKPKNDSQLRDWERWLPGAQLGEVIDTPLNPVIWSSDA